jgi:photosynthetic reaction center cytochrome c subunit
MNMRRRNAWIIVVFAVVVISVGMAILAAPPTVRAQAPGGGPQAPPAPFLPGQTAGQYYKNVTVMKDMPAADLIPAMQYFRDALGTNCGYCHATDFSADDKEPKKTARMMISMVLKINADNFKGGHNVECFSCHQGSTDVATAAPVPELGMKPPVLLTEEPKPAQGLPTSDDLVAKYMQAVGGNISSLTTRIAKGTVEAGPNRVGYEQTFKAPNKAYIVTHADQGDAVQGYDGTTVWAQNPRFVQEIVGPAAINPKRLADFYRTLDLKKSYTAFRRVTKDKIGNTDVYWMIAQAADGSGNDRLYFDANSGLLVRVVQRTATQFGPNPTQYDFSDYRDAGGVKVPFEVRVGAPNAIALWHFTDIKFNTPVDDSIFAKPTAPSKAAAK